MQKYRTMQMDVMEKLENADMNQSLTVIVRGVLITRINNLNFHFLLARSLFLSYSYQNPQVDRIYEGYDFHQGWFGQGRARDHMVIQI